MSQVLAAEKQSLQLEGLQAEKKKVQGVVDQDDDDKEVKKAKERLKELNQEIEEMAKME